MWELKNTTSILPRACSLLMDHNVCYTLEKWNICFVYLRTGPLDHILQKFTLMSIFHCFIFIASIFLKTGPLVIGPYVEIKKYNIYFRKYLFSVNEPYCLLYFRKNEIFALSFSELDHWTIYYKSSHWWAFFIVTCYLHLNLCNYTIW